MLPILKHGRRQVLTANSSEIKVCSKGRLLSWLINVEKDEESCDGDTGSGGGGYNDAEMDEMMNEDNISN